MQTNRAMSVTVREWPNLSNCRCRTTSTSADLQANSNNDGPDSRNDLSTKDTPAEGSTMGPNFGSPFCLPSGSAFTRHWWPIAPEPIGSLLKKIKLTRAGFRIDYLLIVNDPERNWKKNLKYPALNTFLYLIYPIESDIGFIVGDCE